MPDVPLGPFREQIGFTIDAAGIDAALRSRADAIRSALAAKMTYTGMRLQMIIVNDKLQGQLLQHRTGNLGDSVRPIETEVTPTTISGGVTAGGGPVDYARPLEYGSKEHIIRAVNAKMLHFFIEGREFFRYSVMHPGNRAYAFLRGTAEEQKENIISGFQQAAAEAGR